MCVDQNVLLSFDRQFQNGLLNSNPSKQHIHDNDSPIDRFSFLGM